MKNCDRGLENAARGCRPRAAFSNPRSQFFTIRIDPKPANNLFIYLFISCYKLAYKWFYATLSLGSFRLDYEYEIEYEYDFSILVFRLHIITTHTHFIP